jgi:hypothetical protein
MTEMNAGNTPKVIDLQQFGCMVDTMSDWHSEALRKNFIRIQYVIADVEKMCFSSL